MLFTTIFNLTPLIPLSSQERGKKKKEGLKPLSDSRFKIPLALPLQKGEVTLLRCLPLCKGGLRGIWSSPFLYQGKGARGMGWINTL
jgi:hypothetical protein